MELSSWTIASSYTSDLISRSILFRMIALQQRADVWLDDGPPYIVRGYAYWMEIFAVTDYQIKKGLKALRQSGVVETQKRLAYGKTLLHLRLSPSFIAEHSIPVGSKSPNGSGDNCPTGPTTSDEPIYKKDSMNDNKKKKGYALLEPVGSKASPEVSDKVDLIIDKIASFDAARRVWGTYWHRNHDGPVDGFPQFPKARKMWKDFVAKVPNTENPLHLIARAVDNWSEFRDVVKARTGKHLPEYPSLYPTLWNLPSLLDVSSAQAVAPKVIPKKGGKLTVHQMAMQELSKK